MYCTLLLGESMDPIAYRNCSGWGDVPFRRYLQLSSILLVVLCRDSKLDRVPHRRKLQCFQVCVRMLNVHNDTEFIWDRNKFINRKHSMQEMYTHFMNGEDDWDLSKVRLG